MKSHVKVSILMLVSLVVASLPAWAQDNRVVDVINRASSPIFHLYVSDVRSGIWGPDQLGDYEIIRPDHYRTFNMDNGSNQCYFDIRVVLRDGREQIWPGIDVCSADRVTMRD